MTLHDELVPQFMSLDEVALRLKVSKRTIQRYMTREDNPLPVIHLTNKTVRVPWDQFDIWLESMKEK